MNVYWKNSKGTLSKAEVETTDHFDAILEVKEFLVQAGEGYSGAVLAFIPKGKA